MTLKIIFSFSLMAFLSACGETSPKELANEASKFSESTPQKIESVESSKPALREMKTGQQIFAACAGCHGISGEKTALNKSQVIQGWSAEKVIAVLQGYKAGTYGGSMKNLMKAQASSLNDEEIALVAQHISRL